MNGAVDRIAGVTNEAGNVLGLMPHPEHAVDPLLGPTGGVAVLEGLIAAALAPVYQSETGLILANGDPHDARFEVGPGILGRIDLRQHGSHRHGRVPRLDLSQQHPARGIAWIYLRLGRCPHVDG